MHKILTIYALPKYYIFNESAGQLPPRIIAPG